jgi:hypothetical protein
MIFQQSLLYFFLLFFYFLVMRKVAHLNKWGAVGNRPYPFCAANTQEREGRDGSRPLDVKT